MSTDTERKSLSMGDAFVIIALLVFIIVWVGGWMAAIAISYDTNKPIDWFTSVILLFTIVGPAMWAGGVISHSAGKEG